MVRDTLQLDLVLWENVYPYGALIASFLAQGNEMVRNPSVIVSHMDKNRKDKLVDDNLRQHYYKDRSVM